MAKLKPNPRWRLLNQDGTFNVVRVGCARSRWTDAYHRALSTSWPRFLLLVAALYLGVNAVFAALYAALGPGSLDGVLGGSFSARYVHAFFFSVQTFATIGYGKITPISFVANVLVTVEALFGMMSIALAAGLLFARFSKPSARVVFSRMALLQELDGEPSLVFRMANERLNQIAEAQITVVLSRDEVTAEGERYRNYYDLKLERSRNPIFALSWTVVHPIDQDSPLHGMGPRDLEESGVEIIVTLTGIDETFSQTIHARFSYKAWEILWNRRFADILERTDSHVAIDIGGINELEPEKGA